MKKAFLIGLIIFWIITTILLAAGFINYQQNKPTKKANPIKNAEVTQEDPVKTVSTNQISNQALAEPAVETDQTSDPILVPMSDQGEIFQIVLDKNGLLSPDEISISAGDTIEFVYQNPRDEKEIFFTPATIEKMKLDHEHPIEKRLFSSSGVWTVHSKTTRYQAVIIVE